MSVNPKHIAAKRVLDFYLEQLEEDDTTESKWALQFINLQMAKFRCKNMLYSYPVTVTDVE
jgi:hypothetical protein